ncbi:MAG: hypothetical protein SFV23_25930 [Planctomycetaceae bacterium]|nr:hypothetical protein [Planctomycetaceae bacterium]
MFQKSMHSLMAGALLATLGWVASSWGGELNVAPGVSPTEEIEILDPQVDPEGKPRSVLTADGRRIDIPQTVLVHKHFYTGDRDFQGPMLQGGPMLIAVTSPATGERIYVEVQLPPGAPRVYYRRDMIVYVFRDVRVVVDFEKHCFSKGECKPKVTLIERTAKERRYEDKLADKREFELRFWETAGFRGIGDQTQQKYRETVLATTTVVKQASDFVVGKVREIAGSTAIGSLPSTPPPTPPLPPLPAAP